MREDVNHETRASPVAELVGHTRDDGQVQSLDDHLRSVADRAGDFAAVFGATGWGRAVGILHDDGKANDAFQERITALAAGATARRVDHSTPGAKYAATTLNDPPGCGKLIAYCVAGHHTGLPDGKSGDDDTCLSRRLARSSIGPGCLASEIGLIEPPPFLTPPIDTDRVGFQAAFFTRMLFSCLVDADYLDTEQFVDPQRSQMRGEYPDLHHLKRRLETYLEDLAASVEPTGVNRLRAQVLSECRNGASLEPGLFSLTVPTGGGKTLSSLAFALDHAIRHGLRRIIYVIPYTSIIEQTACIFRSILGNEPVLEHHSNLIVDRDNLDEEHEERRRMACENWDPPIIVTTNVQFFESFFSNRSSRTRRLHNAARSVVILDEAQMLPVPFLQPTLEIINELAKSYGSSIVLCTATQPALSANAEFSGGLTDVRELMSNPRKLERDLQRVSSSRIGRVTDDDLAERLANERQALCIVNTRAHARALAELLPSGPQTFHLSALMCPVHRREVLHDIREMLRTGAPCKVVSTQLVEAGVDIDFPVVYRAIAGIDSIVQASGRCNREGRLSGGGRLYVFDSEHVLPPGHIRQSAQVTELVLQTHPNRLIDSETVEAFFRELYWLKGRSGELDHEKILELIAEGTLSGDFPFKTVARRYRLIADDQVPLVVPYDEQATALCRDLQHAPYPGALLRRLQPYTVQLYPRAMASLVESGYVEVVQEEFHMLGQIGMKELYHPRFGLDFRVRERFDPDSLMVL